MEIYRFGDARGSSTLLSEMVLFKLLLIHTDFMNSSTNQIHLFSDISSDNHHADELNIYNIGRCVVYLIIQKVLVY